MNLDELLAECLGFDPHAANVLHIFTVNKRWNKLSSLGHYYSHTPKSKYRTTGHLTHEITFAEKTKDTFDINKVDTYAIYRLSKTNLDYLLIHCKITRPCWYRIYIQYNPELTILTWKQISASLAEFVIKEDYYNLVYQTKRPVSNPGPQTTVFEIITDQAPRNIHSFILNAIAVHFTKKVGDRPHLPQLRTNGIINKPETLSLTAYNLVYDIAHDELNNIADMLIELCPGSVMPLRKRAGELAEQIKLMMVKLLITDEIAEALIPLANIDTAFQNKHRKYPVTRTHGKIGIAGANQKWALSCSFGANYAQMLTAAELMGGLWQWIIADNIPIGCALPIFTGFEYPMFDLVSIQNWDKDKLQDWLRQQVPLYYSWKVAEQIKNKSTEEYKKECDPHQLAAQSSSYIDTLGYSYRYQNIFEICRKQLAMDPTWTYDLAGSLLDGIKRNSGFDTLFLHPDIISCDPDQKRLRKKIEALILPKLTDRSHPPVFIRLNKDTKELNQWIIKMKLN